MRISEAVLGKLNETVEFNRQAIKVYLIAVI